MFQKMLPRVKDWLITIPKDSLRYRFINFSYSEKVIKDSKSCKTYWYLMPMSFIGAIIIGAFVSFATVGGWFTGYTTVDFGDKGTEDTKLKEKAVYYPYKYSPLRGKYKKFVPWEYTTAFALTAGLIYLIWTGSLVNQSLMMIESLFDQRIFIGIGIMVILAFYLLGRAVYKKRNDISAYWEEICPDTVIIASDSEENLKTE